MLIEQMTDAQLGKLVRENLYDTFGNYSVTGETGIATACSIFLIESFIVKGLRAGSIMINDTKDYNGDSLGNWKVTVEQITES